MKACQHCGFKFRLNVISDRWTKRKYLRAGCCNAPLGECPNPERLLRSPNLTAEEKEYLERVSSLDWFGGQVAALLLQIEAKAGVAA